MTVYKPPRSGVGMEGIARNLVGVGTTSVDKVAQGKIRISWVATKCHMARATCNA